jgi:TatA/E family protein of Tat protein translocase
MNGTIFGVGPLEVLMIGILVLLVFGPERLPELTRGMGTALRRMRETYVAFTAEFRGEMMPIASEIDQVTREIRQEVDAIREAADIRSILQPYAEDINKAVKLETLPAQALSQPSAAPKIDSPASATATSSNGATAPSNSIAPPKQAVTSRTTQTKLGRPVPAYTSPVILPEDNPWASIGAEVRTDRLDDDSPWRLQ